MKNLYIAFVFGAGWGAMAHWLLGKVVAWYKSDAEWKKRVQGK